MAKFLDYDGLVHYTSCFKPGLVEVVDSGAKNIYQITYVPTVSGVTISKTDTNTVAINGTFSSATNMFFTLSADNVILPAGSYVVFAKTTGTMPKRPLTITPNIVTCNLGSYAEFELATDQQIGLYVNFYTNDVVSGSISIMICTKAAWNISHEYQPYRPPYQEFYEQVETNKNNILSIYNTGFAQKNVMHIVLDEVKAIQSWATFINNTITIGNLVVTFNDDNSITLNGSHTADVAINFKDLSYINIPTNAVGAASANIALSNDIFFGLWGDNGVPNLVLNDGVDIPSDYASKYSRGFIIRVSANTVCNNVRIYPMVCDKALYQASPEVVPYALSNVELTAKEQANESNISLAYGGIVGKNKIYPHDIIDTFDNDITYIINPNNTITFRGTATSNRIMYFPFTVPETGNYMLTGCPSNGGGSTYYQQIRETPSVSTNMNDSGNGRLVTLSANTTYYLTILIISGVNMTNVTFSQMICKKTDYDVSSAYQPYVMSNTELTAKEQSNENNILSIQQEQIVQNADIATLRLALDTKIYGIRIDKQDANPDTRVTYLYDAVGMTPAYMDFNSGSFNYGSWADIWFIKNNRPVALKFDGTVDYELDHTDFTKKLDGTASDVSDLDYGGNFMSEMPTVYVKRWEDSRYNYIAFSDKQVNSDFLAQAHTNANGTVNPYIYLPMFKGWKDSNNKLRSLMGTYPTGNITGANEVTYASNCGAGWQLWDKAKIDLVMDLIVLITKSTNCRAKIGNGDCMTYNASDTTNYGKMKSGYETDGTTRSANAQFYGSESTEVTNYGKHHMIAFYIEDLWGNRLDRCLGFNLVDNVYKVKMTPPYVLDSDNTYQSLSATPPISTEGWLKNVSSGVYGDVPTEVGASNASGFANYFYRNVSGNRLSLFGGGASDGLKVGRFWALNNGSGNSSWFIGGSPCYTAL